MVTKIIDKVGEWNPQLFREMKGKFKPRNLMFTIGLSLMAWFIFYLMCWEKVCLDNYIQWRSLYPMLTWLLPVGLILGGVYQISNDFAQEEKRGTLNFIRLSPQSSQSILLGKFLGVPGLIYLGLGLLFPWHFISGLHLGRWGFWLLGEYSLWLAGCWLFYNIAVFATQQLIFDEKKSPMGAGVIGALCCIGTLVFALPYISILNFSWEFYHNPYFQANWYWFFLPLGKIPFLAYLWLIISVCVGSFWVWLAINRRFRNSNATLLSKGQSYGLVICLNLWLLGLVFPGQYAYNAMEGGGLVWLFLFYPAFFLMLSAVLIPPRQALLDWARYRNLNNTKWDLIWGEKSPPIVAIALNLAITAIIWLPWIFLLKQSVFNNTEIVKSEIIMALFMTINMILIYGVIAQKMVLLVRVKSETIMTVTVAAVIFLPLIMQGLLTQENVNFPLLWVFSPVPISVFIEGSMTTAFLGLFLQFGLLGLLTQSLTKQIQKAGESESKVLFD